jgi:hypothetical protein
MIDTLTEACEDGGFHPFVLARMACGAVEGMLTCDIRAAEELTATEGFNDQVLDIVVAHQDLSDCKLIEHFMVSRMLNHLLSQPV